MTAILVLIGLFLSITGSITIIKSIQKLGSHKSDSTLETKLFKFSAPVGFTYGIVAFLSVAGLVKLQNVSDQTDKINGLEIENENLKTENSRLHSNQKDTGEVSFEVHLYSHDVKSIMNGKVLIQIEKPVFSDPRIKVQGIIGMCELKSKVFKDTTVTIAKGKRFYMMTKDSVIWGVNVLDEMPYKLEFINKVSM